eukprot:3290494-Ditylum_brightwellii.AAC.1
MSVVVYQILQPRVLSLSANLRCLSLASILHMCPFSSMLMRPNSEKLGRHHPSCLKLHSHLRCAQNIVPSAVNVDIFPMMQGGRKVSTDVIYWQVMGHEVKKSAAMSMILVTKKAPQQDGQ